MDQANFEKYVREVTDTTRQTLFKKNKSYGGSAVIEDGIFSKLSVEERLAVRIDDKVQRIRTLGFDGFGEDNLNDLIGYLVILKAYREYRKHNSEQPTSSPESEEQPGRGLSGERENAQSEDQLSLAGVS